MLTTDDPVVYADSSALVKLIVTEAESRALEDYLDGSPVLATSKIALIEVPQAVAVATARRRSDGEMADLLDALLLIDVDDGVVRRAAGLTTQALRTLDAIHLASAMELGADELVAYDRRLLAAAREQDLSVAHPGLTDPAALPG